MDAFHGTRVTRAIAVREKLFLPPRSFHFNFEKRKPKVLLLSKEERFPLRGKDIFISLRDPH